MDDVIDIGRAIETLLRRWKLILITTVPFVIASLFLVSRPLTNARAVVAVVKESSNVSLGSALQTQSDFALTRNTKPADRLNSFAQFINNPRIASAVIAKLGDALPPELTIESQLLNTVSGKVLLGSDSLEILVTNPNPDLAAEIANLWAEEYVIQVNALYQEGSVAMREMIHQQVINAQQSLLVSQEAMEQFLAEDERAEIDRLIVQNEADIALLDETLDVLSPEAQDYAKAIQVLVQERHDELDRLTAEIVETESLLQRAEDMRSQIRAGGDVAAQSNTLSLLMFKTEVFSSERRADLDVSVSSIDSTVSASDMIRDLDALVETIEKRLLILRAESEELSLLLLNGVDPMVGDSLIPAPVNMDTNGGLGLARQVVGQEIVTLQQDNNDLRRRRMQETFRFEALTSDLSLAQKAYDALVVRETELAMSAWTTDTQVRVAVPAAVPNYTAVSKAKLAKNGVIAAAAGVAAGCILAWIVQVWVDYRQRVTECIGG